MSIASVSGRLRAQRLAARYAADPNYKPPKAKPQPRSSAKPLHAQYRYAWRKAGKPADFPSMADWIARTDK